MEERISIFKRSLTASVDRNTILNAVQECRMQFTACSLDKLEEDLTFFMMPCLRILFSEIYADNQKIDSIELIEELLANLTITLSLTDFIQELLNFVTTQLESANLKLFKSIISEIPKCIFLTFMHCKESQKKYQNLLKDCNEIILLYKKNQECHTTFLNIMCVLSIDDDESSTKILIETIQSLTSIIGILLGLNIKALADSWKSFCSITEKHSEILVENKFYCIKEIELLETQIRYFMNLALESNDKKQVLQHLKISGFLLKIGLKIVVKFWQYIQLDHLESVYNLICSVYNYSPDFLPKKSLGADVKDSIQLCLLDIITSFVEEKLLCEDVFKQILSYSNTTNKYSVGCLEFSLKILEFVASQPPDSVDATFFSAVMNFVFDNLVSYFPDTHSEDSLQIPAEFIEKASSQITQTIEVHNSFYNVEFESVIISKILGNHIGCHILASAIWCYIISQSSPFTRKELVSDLLKEIDHSQIELTFTSSKVIFLKNFMHKLFAILDEEEKAYFLKLYPSIEYIRLWRIVGVNHITENENSFLFPLLELLSNNQADMKSLTSFEDVIKLIESVKILAGASNSILKVNTKTLTDFIKSLWELNYEAANSDNVFYKYFISSLSESTKILMNHFSNDQILFILKRMEMLATNPFLKLKLCFILGEISTRKPEHNMEQNKLHFLLSDLLELLLKENIETIRELGLKIFQLFARNNQYIIVNNVSRMLPDMNLEKFLQNNSVDICLENQFQLMNFQSLEHKCLVEIRKSISVRNSFEINSRNLTSRETSLDSFDGKSFSRECSFETRNESPIPINKPIVEYKRNTNFNNRTSQCKRMKLGDDVQEDDDTISEVLQRIKSEIKCLNKILSKEQLTAKNAQNIKLLACQLHNILDT